MKLVTFTHQNRTRIGELVGDTVHALAWQDKSFDLIRRGLSSSNRTGQRFQMEEVKLEAPLRPGKIVAIGLNYAQHASETEFDLPSKPLIFAKFPSTIIGPGDEVVWRSSIAGQVDWEVELAVVIGKKARDVAEEDAFRHVFGYTIANDVSARDLQLREDGQWTRGKSLDTFCPLGPCIVTADDIDDPQNLNLQLRVNGEVLQDSNTSYMIFNVAQLIAYCSRMFTLDAGDILLTGTPPGVGEGMNPPRYLADGDEMTVSIEGIGEMSNTCRVLD